MRMMETSTDVYAAVWAARLPGEDTEDAILRRLLKVPPVTNSALTNKVPPVGLRDARFDITLPEGFEIFRTYKGTEYRAQAIGGKWRLKNTGKNYDSLNQLSKATSGNIENAWRNWNFTGKDGRRYKIEGLRNDQSPNVRHQL